MKKFVMNFILVFVLITPLIFSFQANAESFKLEWKSYPEKLNYTFVNNIDFIMDLGQEEDMNWQMVQEMSCSQEIEKEEDGNLISLVSITDYSYDLGGIALKEEELNEMQKISQAMIGRVMRIKMSPRGEILEVNYPEGFDSLGNSFNYNFSAILPKGQVEIGDSWDNELDVKLPLNDLGEMPLKMKFRYTLVDRKRIKGYDCLLIGFSGDVNTSFKNSLGEDMDMTVKIDMDMEGYYYFALEEGILIKSVVEGDMDGEMIVPIPLNVEKGEFINQKFNMDVVLKSIMDLSDVE